MSELASTTLFTKISYSKYLSSTLSKGVDILLYIEKSIEDILVNQIKISKDDVENKIKTVFLDGHPVDEISEILVPEGATLSLAAAMPGIVGICMGRNSPVAAFRSDISAVAKSVTNPAKIKTGRIRLKLFNTTINLAGENVLSHGIILKNFELAEILQDKIKIFEKETSRAEFCGNEITIQNLIYKLKTSDAETLFRVIQD